jgi:hypothetical protein
MSHFQPSHLRDEPPLGQRDSVSLQLSSREVDRRRAARDGGIPIGLDVSFSCSTDPLVTCSDFCREAAKIGLPGRPVRPLRRPRAGAGPAPDPTPTQAGIVEPTEAGFARGEIVRLRAAAARSVDRGTARSSARTFGDTPSRSYRNDNSDSHEQRKPDRNRSIVPYQRVIPSVEFLFFSELDAQFLYVTHISSYRCLADPVNFRRST